MGAVPAGLCGGTDPGSFNDMTRRLAEAHCQQAALQEELRCAQLAARTAAVTASDSAAVDLDETLSRASTGLLNTIQSMASQFDQFNSH